MLILVIFFISRLKFIKEKLFYECRAQAKRMFGVLMQDPVFDRAVHKYLTTSVIRNIQRTLDQLRKNI